jgi:hypothetical protein
MGAPILARAAFRRAFGPAVRGAAVAAVGPRAFDAARIVGARPVAPGEELPAPIPTEARPSRERLRVDWGIPDDGLACLLVASPPGCADARVALDIVGRAAVLGRPMTLIAHPGSRHAERAQAWSGVAGGAWRDTAASSKCITRSALSGFETNRAPASRAAAQTMYHGLARSGKNATLKRGPAAGRAAKTAKKNRNQASTSAIMAGE